jgi:hypothetical protein
VNETGVEAVRLTEVESETALTIFEKGCEGTQAEAGAQSGHLCLFQSSGPGATEPLWKGAKFVRMAEPDGVQSIASGFQGDLAVFQTTGFVATGKGTVPAGGAYLAAGGAWAVRAPTVIP